MKTFLFSCQNKTYEDSWVSKTDSSDTEPAAERTLGLLTHGYWRVREETRQASCRAFISWKQRTEKESSLPINVSGSKRASTHAQCEQWWAAQWWAHAHQRKCSVMKVGLSVTKVSRSIPLSGEGNETVRKYWHARQRVTGLNASTVRAFMYYSRTILWKASDFLFSSGTMKSGREEGWKIMGPLNCCDV